MKKLSKITLLPLAGLAACGGADKSDSDSTKDRPNIIWIYADDHDQRAISAYGGTLIETPNIDKLAKEGMLFENSFVTNSICAPCRAVILTGKYSHLNGVRDNKAAFDTANQTFPELLQRAGYNTAFVGKYHLKTSPEGFDYWNKLPGQGHYYDPHFIENGDTIRVNGYVTDITTDFALRFLDEKRDKSKPFMLMLQNKAPHGPWMPAPRHLSLYKNDTFPVPETFFHDCSKRGTPACEQDMNIYKKFTERQTLMKMYDKQGDSIITEKWLSWLYSLLEKEEQQMFDDAYLEENRAYNKANFTQKEKEIWAYQRYIKDYLRCIKAIDENVGRVLQYLEDNGLEDNTIVMYSSDQGFYLGEFGWYDKRFMYEKSLRTPLIVKWPGVTKPGSKSKEMVLNLDMAETFIDIAGAKIPGDMQGKSLVPLLKEKNDKFSRDAIYYHYYEFPKPHHVYPHYGVRTRDKKLIHFYTIDEWEFYDLGKDPQELENKIDKSKYQEDIKDLKIKIIELQKKYKDEQ